MSIEIVVKNKIKKSKLLNPVEIFGAEHGKVFQQYAGGKPQKCYAIGAGGCEPVIDIWYNDESNTYRLSSSNKSDLKGFLSHVKYREIDASVKIEICVNK